MTQDVKKGVQPLSQSQTVQMLLVFGTLFAIGAAADWLSTVVGLTYGQAREANPVMADEHGGFTSLSFVLVNVVSLMCFLGAGYWALRNTQLIPVEYVRTPWRSWKDSFDLDFSFRPLKQANKGRTVFMVLSIAVLILLFRTIVVVSNLSITIFSVGFFGHLVGLLESLLPDWAVYPALIVIVISPLYLISTMLASIWLRKRLGDGSAV